RGRRRRRLPPAPAATGGRRRGADRRRAGVRARADSAPTRKPSACAPSPPRRPRRGLPRPSARATAASARRRTREARLRRADRAPLPASPGGGYCLRGLGLRRREPDEVAFARSPRSRRAKRTILTPVEQTKYLLDESQLPRHWYNVAADMPNA